MTYEKPTASSHADDDQATLVLESNDGKHYRCRILDLFQHDGQDYALLVRLAAPQVEDSLVIMRVIERDGQPVFQNIENQQEFDRVLAHVKALAARSNSAVTPPSREQLPTQGGARNVPASREMRLRVGDRLVPVTGDLQLHEDDLPGLHANGTNGVVATVSRNPADETVLGLKNLSTERWIAMPPDGGRRDVAPGRSVRLYPAMRIICAATTITVE